MNARPALVVLLGLLLAALAGAVWLVLRAEPEVPTPDPRTELAAAGERSPPGSDVRPPRDTAPDSSDTPPAPEAPTASRRERERVEPERDWRAARDLLADADRWGRAGDAARESVAAAVAERARGFTFVDVRSYSSGGATYQIAVFQHTRTGLEFALIPGGTFQMGSPVGESGRQGHEGPRHEVTVSPFLMARTEVTQRAWQREFEFMPAHFEGADLPVEEVTHKQAAKYCARVGLRLPTEAEWEFACRAGTDTPWSFGSDAAALERHGWHRQIAGDRTHPVGQKEPNAYGLHDMHGNVWEWCSDRWGPYAVEYQFDPSGPETGDYRVIRGGSWWDDALGMRSANRLGWKASQWNVGFRPVWPLPK